MKGVFLSVYEFRYWYCTVEISLSLSLSLSFMIICNRNVTSGQT